MWSRLAWRLRGAAALNLCFVGLLGLFAYTQLSLVVADHQFTSVPFAVNFSLLLLVSIVRRRPMQSTGRAVDWLFAASTWIPLAMQPSDTTRILGLVGATIATVGAGFTAVSVVSLGRSFGVVAANRGISTRGAYGVLRHPLYAAEMVSMAGNLVANPSVLNAGIVILALPCVPLRIFAEERLLGSTAEYRTYMARVRWRLVPGLY